MEDVRNNDVKKKEDWEAPMLTVLAVEEGTEGGASSGPDHLNYS